MISYSSSTGAFLALYFIWITICFFTPISCQSHVEPPIVEVTESEIKVGQKLTLTCEGEFELSWKLPNSTGIQDRKTVSSSTDDNHVKPFHSNLQVRDTIFTDTGPYVCYYKEYDGTSDMDLARSRTSTYIFISDPEHMFLPMPFAIPAMQNSQLVIPCRPTSLDVSVELYKGMDEKGEKIEETDGIYFDPERGYVVFVATIFYSSQFTCIGTLLDKKEKASVQLMWFNVPNSVPSPFINDSMAKNVIENSEFFLSCQVRARLEVIPFLQWSYPNKGSARIVEGKTYTVVKDDREYRTSFLNLTVYNSQKSDEGTYKCTVTDQTGKTNSKTTSISIYDAADAYIELEPQGFESDETLEYPLGQKDLKLSVKVKSFPYPDVKWYKGDDEIVADERHAIILQAGYSVLVIKNLIRQDTANYTLVGTAGHASKNLTVTLLITEKPVIHLNSTSGQAIPLVFLHGSKFTLVCRAEGCPLPYVEWSWSFCSDMLSTTNCLDYTPLPMGSSGNNETMLTTALTRNRCVTTVVLRGTANVQGFYRCSASNSVGSVMTETPFVLNDFDKNFYFHVSKLKPFELDKVNFTCAVSIFYYSELRLVMATGIHYNVSVNSTVSPYTNISVAIINPIRLDDSGKYACEAFNIETKAWERLSKDVKVIEIAAPTINKTNMNNTGYSLKKEEDFELFCYVNGIPSPKMSWYINGTQINTTNDRVMQLSDNNMRLIIPRVVPSDSGNYICQASNRAGNLLLNATLTVLDVQEGGIKTFAIVIIVVVIVLVIILVVVGVAFGKRCYYDRKNKIEIKALQKMLFTKGEMGIYNPDIPLEDQVDCLPYDQRWEFPREKLKLGRIIGQGAFGRVIKADAIGIVPGEESRVVAVKMLKEHADMEQRKALMQELKIMIHVGQHVNVVNLLGAVTHNLHRGEFYVIVEYCRFGNLRNYIYLHRDSFFNQINGVTDQIEKDKRASDVFLKPAGCRESDQIFLPTGETNTASTTDGVAITSDGMMSQTGGSDRTSVLSSTMKKFRTSRILTTSDLVCYSFQIACGMEYLSSKKVVHRDLALRNVLLAEDNILKICDFGLAKDCYTKNYYRKKSDGRLPVKWMAVESLRDKVFSTESDVWSLGVVMWELFTLGSSPYPGLDANEEFYKKLLNGSRMEKPEYSTEHLYYMMLECWKHDPKQRPNFTELRERLAVLMDVDEVQHFNEMNKHLQTNQLAPPDYILMGDIKEDSETGEHDYVNMNKDVTSTDNDGYLIASPLPTVLGGKGNPFADEQELKPMLDSGYGNGYFDMGKDDFTSGKV